MHEYVNEKKEELNESKTAVQPKFVSKVITVKRQLLVVISWEL